MNPILSNIIAISSAILLFISMRLPKVIKHSLYSAILLITGTIPLLHLKGIIGFTIPSTPIIVYALRIVIAVTGGSLLWEGIKEDSIIRWPTIIVGASIMAMSIIPTLYNFGAITFNIPPIPNIAIYIVRILGGILLAIAIFLIG